MVAIPTHNTIVTRKKILLVDDHPILRHGLLYLLNQERDLVVIISFIALIASYIRSVYAKRLIAMTAIVIPMAILGVLFSLLHSPSWVVFVLVFSTVMVMPILVGYYLLTDPKVKRYYSGRKESKRESRCFLTNKNEKKSHAHIPTNNNE